MANKTQIIETRIEIETGLYLDLTEVQTRFIVKLINAANAEPWYQQTTTLLDFISHDHVLNLFSARVIQLLIDPMVRIENPTDLPRIIEIGKLIQLYHFVKHIDED